MKEVVTLSGRQKECPKAHFNMSSALTSQFERTQILAFFLCTDVHLCPIWYEYFLSGFLAPISLSRLCVLPLGLTAKSRMCKKGEKGQGRERFGLKFINKCLTFLMMLFISLKSHLCHWKFCSQKLVGNEAKELSRTIWCFAPKELQQMINHVPVQLFIFILLVTYGKYSWFTWCCESDE